MIGYAAPPRLDHPVFFWDYRRRLGKPCGGQRTGTTGLTASWCQHLGLPWADQKPPEVEEAQ
jgi:hypothetical protein